MVSLGPLTLSCLAASFHFDVYHYSIALAFEAETCSDPRVTAVNGKQLRFRQVWVFVHDCPEQLDFGSSSTHLSANLSLRFQNGNNLARRKLAANQGFA